MATWPQIRAAIQSAIASASGLASGKVIWKFQDGPQPALDYVALHLSPLRTIGRDGINASTDLDRTAGQEIELRVGGLREMVLSVEVFTAAVADGSDALARGETIRTALSLPTVRDVLGAVGVVPFDPGPVQYTPAIAAAGFRGRGLVEIRCSLPAPAAVEYLGYIDTVNGTHTTTGGALGSDANTFTAP